MVHILLEDKIDQVYGGKTNLLLHAYSIGSTYLDSGWVIHPFSGSLLKVNKNDLHYFNSSRIPPLVKDASIKCDNPFLLNPTNKVIHLPNNQTLSKVTNTFSFFSKITKINFLLSYQIAGLMRRAQEISSKELLIHVWLSV